jgi:hypothetical protein
MRPVCEDSLKILLVVACCLSLLVGVGAFG